MSDSYRAACYAAHQNLTSQPEKSRANMVRAEDADIQHVISRLFRRRYMQESLISAISLDELLLGVHTLQIALRKKR